MKMKKFLSGLLVMLTAVSCSSVKNKDSRNTGGNKRTVISVNESSEGICNISSLPMPEGLSSVTDLLFDESSGNVYMVGTDSSGDMKIVVTDSNFGFYRLLATDIEFNSTLEPDSRIIFGTDENRLYAVIIRADSESPESTYHNRIFVIDPSGELISSGDIETEGEAITDIACAGGQIVVCTGTSCISVNGSGDILAQVNNELSRIISFSDGRITGSKMEKGNSVLCDIDPETLKADEMSVAIPETINGEFSRGTGVYLAYISSGTGVYGLKEDNSMDRIINFTASGISGVTKICPVAGGDFIAVSGGSPVRISAGDPAEFGEIQELTLAVAGKYDRIQQQVSDFNAQSTRYRLKINDYSAGYEYSIQGLEAAANDLEMDIISGKIPDIVWLDSGETALLANMGAFADIYDFMDSDSKFTREAFLSNYLEACETNGHLYSIEPSFMIETICAKKKFVTKQDWTFADFKQTFDSMPDDMQLFPNGNNNAAVLSFLTDSGSNFIDYKNFTCNFNTDEFINILEFANTFPGVDEYNFEQGSCRDDTALLDVLYISSFRDINRQIQGGFGEEIAFAGFPSETGAGSRILRGNQFAVMADSPNKEAAWEFIRSILDNYGYAEGIPVTERKFALAADDALERYSFIEENGEKIFMDETYTDWSTGAEINISPMTETERDRYAAFVRSIKKASSGTSDSSVISIISEETELFFNGECSSKQAAETIQERISIMLSERSN